MISGTVGALEIPWKCCSTARVKLIGLRANTRTSTIEIDFTKKQAENSSQHDDLGSLPANQITLSRRPGALPVAVFPQFSTASH